jgi:hypothetical protein
MSFSSSKMFFVSPDYIPVVSEDLKDTLKGEGYDVALLKLMSGDVEISISKGGLFRSVLGLKTALKIVLAAAGDNINVSCSVGIFGQQAVPTMISMLFFWPVMITQIWGLVRQSELDDHVIGIVDDSLKKHAGITQQVGEDGSKQVFCSACGARVKGVFCSACGMKL